MAIVTKTYFLKGRTRLAVTIMALSVTLASCSQFDERQENLVFLQPVIGSDVETTVSVNTRSTLNVTGTTGTYDDDIPQGTVVRAFAVPSTNSTDDRAAGTFTRTQSGWRSTLGVKTGISYSLYAYSPSMLSGASAVTFDWDAKAIKFNNIDILTTIDPWVCIAAKGQAVSPETTAPSTPLTKNNFDIGTIGIVANNQVHKVWLAMDHLFAKATIYFKVDSAFNSIRTIRLNSATISTNQGVLRSGVESHTYKFGEGISWNGGYTNNEPRSIDLINGESAHPDINLNADGPDTITLDRTAKEFAWFCFLPKNDIPDFKLTVDYEMFDKADTLAKTHHSVTNTLNLRSIKGNAPQAGNNYKITIIVNPTYLNVLTDNDADSELELE